MSEVEELMKIVKLFLKCGIIFTLYADNTEELIYTKDCIEAPVTFTDQDIIQTKQ